MALGGGLIHTLGRSRLNWLLVFVPVSLVLDVLGLPRLGVFVTAALSLVPIAALIGHATDHLARRVGPGIGGLLNATFGNATELIIALFALAAGLQDVVKASISGSIIGNILLVLGLSIFLGGQGRQKQNFNQTAAGAGTAMLFLAVVALVMPAVFDLTVFGNLTNSGPSIESLSLAVAVVLLATYIGSLIFSLRTHRDLFTPASGTPGEDGLSVRAAVLLLLTATVLAAVESELLVGAIDEARMALGMSEFFVGVIVVAVVGNAAEHFSAVAAARRNDVDLAVSISTGSATQIALFVAPVLVFAALLLGSPMSLVFNAFEIVGVAFSVLALAIVSLDGETNWFEGLQLMAVYLVLAIVFFFVPTP